MTEACCYDGCPKQAIHYIHEFHIDVWLAVYPMCDDHVDYIKAYIKSAHNRWALRGY